MRKTEQLVKISDSHNCYLQGCCFISNFSIVYNSKRDIKGEGMMKRYEARHNKYCRNVVAVILLISILIVLSGCSSNSDKSSTAPSSSTSTAQTSESNLADEDVENKEPSLETVTDSEQNTVSDLVIPISDISETAVFYPVEIDGVKLEVLAVKAPDGSIRTAFNTCQVCYDSGRGYYKQDGNVLVCQNCGNRFTMDKVEVQSGGCNPVPIFAENKTVENENITISGEFLAEAKGIFANWKTQY